MAGWNGSNNAGAAPTPQKSKDKGGVSSAVVKGLLGGLSALVVALAVGYFAFSREKTVPQTKTEKKSAAIKAATPAAAPTNTVAKVRPKWEWDVSETNGFTRYEQRKWEIAHRPRPKTVQKAVDRRTKCEIFKHRSENVIALLITRKPGQGIIGTPVYGPAFEKDFLESCEEPILAEEGDDEYTRDLKKLMNETKIELRQRMADGENLSDILMDAHKELQRLGQVKQAVENDMRKMMKETAETEADVDACFEAANKLLESKGIAPMKSSPLLRRSFYNMVKNHKNKETK